MNENKQAEPVAHVVIAGVLFDFMGWLTSRDERIVLSSRDYSSPAVDAIHQFSEMRGFSLDGARVQDWQTATHSAQPVQPAGAQGEPVGEVVDPTYVHFYGDKQYPYGTKIYTAPPAAAINEQMLEALITASALINGCNMKINPVREKLAAAIAAAKAEKAKGGV